MQSPAVGRAVAGGDSRLDPTSDFSPYRLDRLERGAIFPEQLEPSVALYSRNPVAHTRTYFPVTLAAGGGWSKPPPGVGMRARVPRNAA